jgi:IstB-like ATP binding protein
MGKIFPDQAMTLAAIDCLVHHATILEMNVDSYRRKVAVDKARGAGRPPTRATIKGSILIVGPRQSDYASRKYRLRYRWPATIILPPRRPKWPS